jgi:hypothetical protein
VRCPCQRAASTGPPAVHRVPRVRRTGSACPLWFAKWSPLGHHESSGQPDGNPPGPRGHSGAEWWHVGIVIQSKAQPFSDGRRRNQAHLGPSRPCMADSPVGVSSNELGSVTRIEELRSS